MDTFIITDKIYNTTFPKKLEYGEVVSEMYIIRPNSKDMYEQALNKNTDAYI
jgi:hypothetical protein